MPNKEVKIPDFVYTNLFLKFISKYVEEFRKSNGRGRWLAEYKRMDENGQFKPEVLRSLYIDILKNKSSLPFICWDAVNYICVYAFDATKAYIDSCSYEIRVVTGEIAFSDDDKELVGLSKEEALSTCKAMNDEAEEILFVVYNSVTHKQIRF